MRILVVVNDPDLRAARVDALARIEMPAAGACDALRVTLEARALSPDVLLLDGFPTAAAARQALQRARDVTERPPVALLLLPDDATWLRTPLPPDVRPASVLASSGVDDATLAQALASMRLRHAELRESAQAHELRLDLRSREVTNERGKARLTAPEATLLQALLDQPTTVLRLEDLARVLYGHPLSDPRSRTAIHGHMTALRTKLGQIGAQDQVEAIRTLGYRLVEVRRRGPPARPSRPRPPG